MDRLTVPFEIKQFDADDKFFTFEGYASTFGNIDEGNDKVIKGAFADDLAELKSAGKTVPILWQHDTREPVGVFSSMMEDEKGLFVHGRMPKDDSFVKDRVMPQLRIGSIKSLSIGYGIKSGGAVFNGNVRELRALKLYETSLVTFPMNTEAEITRVKSIDFDQLNTADIRALEAALKDGVRFSSKTAKTVISMMKKAGLLRDEQTADRDGVMATVDEILKTLREI